MDDASQQALLSGIRSLLIAAGASLTAKGLIDSTTWNQVVGAIMVILPAAWGAWDKYRSETATKAREAVALNVGIAVADRTAGVTPPVQADHAPAIIKAFADVATVPGVTVSPSSPVLPQPAAAQPLPFGVARP